MKIIHHNDLDGRCAANIVALKYGMSKFENENSFYEADYVDKLTSFIYEIKEDEEIFIVDYSFSESTIDQLDAILHKTQNVVWIDHHASSLKLIETNPKYNSIAGIRQNGISGAALTYMYLYDCEFSKVPEYIQIVSDFDCWQFNFGERTMCFKFGIETYDYSPKSYIWVKLKEESDSNMDEFLNSIIDIGTIIYEYSKMEYKEYCDKYSYESVIFGNKCLVVNRKSGSPIFGDKINEYPVVMCWCFNGKTYDYSIYSENPSIDCSEIAELYGGGGHKGAAGFNLDIMPFTEVF